MFDLMSMMQDMQEKVKSAQNNLANIIVQAEVENDAIIVQASANKVITNISINPNTIKNCEPEQLEDLILVAINRVLEKATQAAEAEMANATGGILPPDFDINALL